MIITVGSIPMFNIPPVQANYPAQLRFIEAAYNTCSVTSDPYVCVSFYPLTNSQISRYAIYRSIIGFESLLPEVSAMSGKTLEVSINLGPVQTVVFDGVTPIVDRLNTALVDTTTVLSKVNSSKMLLRVNGDTTPGCIEIIGGTAMADFGLTPRMITKQTQETLVNYVKAKATDDTKGVEYCDPDGNFYDSYRVSTIDLNNNESIKSRWVQPQETVGQLCWVYGLIADAAGHRMVDVIIKAHVVEYPQTVCEAFLDKDVEPTTTTDSMGRFELALVQGALVEISVPAISYTRNVKIPEQVRVALADLLVERDYVFTDQTFATRTI